MFALEVASRMMQVGKVFVRADDEDLEDLFDQHDTRKQILLRGILLSRVKGKDGVETFNFIHKSILEHFACKSGIFEINKISNIVDEKKNIDYIFNCSLIIDLGMLQFYKDFVREDSKRNKVLL